MSHTIYHTLVGGLLLFLPFLTTAQEITNLILVNATTNRDIQTLRNGDTINLSETGTTLNIRAETAPAVIGSVFFEGDNGMNSRTESVAPYAMAGDNNGNYKVWTPNLGAYTLNATPFSGSSRTGTKGATKTIRFVVIDQAPDNTGGDDGGGVPPPKNPATGKVSINGEARKWHTLTLSFTGPYAKETDTHPNPFLDYRLDVTFTNGKKSYKVPGYFAADGNAANTGASEGNIWRVNFSPDETGTWKYTVSFRLGKDAAVSEDTRYGAPVSPLDGMSGNFTVAATNKMGYDFRGKGRLEYVGERYLKFAETGTYFLKQGADSPENFLSYKDFDGDFKTDGHKDELVKTWQPHVQDWKSGDPSWQNGKGKGIVGAVNYLASKGLNAVSFLTFNVNGDDQNVFPFISYTDFEHYDCSKLDQWEIVFEHAQRKGVFLHFKTQETENQNLLDDGNTTRLRKLYYRELIARFGHHLALNWNLGEENGQWGSVKKYQNTTQRKAMAQYFYDHDPYHHLIVIHNGQTPDDLLGKDSKLTGFSMQTDNRNFSEVHGNIKSWIQKSTAAGKVWVVSCDEPGDAKYAVLPDNVDKDHDDARTNALWGTLLAGGAGNEWYFGYGNEESDLTLQNFRSRDLWWDQCRNATRFFEKYDIPFWDMKNNDALVTTESDYCFYKDREIYLLLIKDKKTTSVNLPEGQYTVSWYNPQNGGSVQKGSQDILWGGSKVSVGNAPGAVNRDWVVLIQQVKEGNTPEAPASSAIFKMYPNPAEEQLTVDAASRGIKKIRIYSVEGKMQKIIELDNEPNTFEVKVSDLLDGIYFLQVESTDGVATERFVKK